jgi:hypothetical protein
MYICNSSILVDFPTVYSIMRNPETRCDQLSLTWQQYRVNHKGEQADFCTSDVQKSACFPLVNHHLENETLSSTLWPSGSSRKSVRGWRSWSKKRSSKPIGLSKTPFFSNPWWEKIRRRQRSPVRRTAVSTTAMTV